MNTAGLKVGDPVTIFRSGWGIPDIAKSEVVEVTKGGNYKLKDRDGIWDKQGRRRGDESWSRTYFEPFDQTKWDEISESHRAQRDRSRLGRVDFGKTHIAIVRQILELLGEDKESE